MEPETDLDDEKALAATDASGMLGVLAGFPDQLRAAADIGQAGIDLPSADGANAVVVLGMGGSGISGDVVGFIPGSTMGIPVVTVKGYRLPPIVDGNTLVFAVSYSGNTEETLDCVEQAIGRGARVIAVTSGGKLADIASERAIPLYRMPGGLQPRASLGYLFVPVAVALERMGLASGLTDGIRAAASMLDERATEYAPSKELEENPTKRLAKDLLGYMPVVYGSEGHVAIAALRWKAQLNEMAKVPAFCNWFPELNHNETVGWQNLGEVCSRTHLVVLRERGEHPRVAKRIEITLELLEDSVGRVTQVCARGETPLEKLLDLVYFGDWTSVYLALALGEDPTPVTRIEELKKRMASSD